MRWPCGRASANELGGVLRKLVGLHLTKRSPLRRGAGALWAICGGKEQRVVRLSSRNPKLSFRTLCRRTEPIRAVRQHGSGRWASRWMGLCSGRSTRMVTATGRGTKRLGIRSLHWRALATLRLDNSATWGSRWQVFCTGYGDPEAEHKVSTEASQSFLWSPLHVPAWWRI